MSRIFITGDTHGGIDLYKLNSEPFPEGDGLCKEDYVIIAGDFGFLWDANPSQTELYNIKLLNSKPWTTLFLDGNHENFDRLDKLRTEQKFGNPVGVVSESIYHLRRGYVYTIAGKTFWTFGGGFSIDKYRRTEGISWWAREMPSEAEFERGLASLEAVDNKVDYIITHSCSNRMFNELSGQTDLNHKVKGEDNLRMYFDRIDNLVDRKMWYYGHFHYDCLFDDHQELYHLVNEITT